MSEHKRDGGSGFSGSSLMFWFAGGALVGAAVAYLAQPRNREHLREFAQRTLDGADRLPTALREASTAAQAAFAESRRDGVHE
jgi:gas vesicle protein